MYSHLRFLIAAGKIPQVYKAEVEPRLEILSIVNKYIFYHPNPLTISIYQ